MANSHKHLEKEKPNRKAGRPKKSFDLPVCRNAREAENLTGVPAGIWLDARRRSAPGIDRSGLIHPRVVLSWLYGDGANGESTDWKGRRLKAQALRAELDLEIARGEVIPAGDVQHGISRGIALAFAVWDRQSSLLPAKGKGMDEPGLKRLMIDAAEEAKGAMKSEFGKWIKEKE